MRPKKTDRSDGLRRARSSLSNQSRQRNSSELADPLPFDAATAHLHAVAAGRRVYCPSPGARQSPARPNSKQSVRYAGSHSNTPLVQRSITRRQAQSPRINPKCSSSNIYRSCSTRSLRKNSNLLTALPEVPVSKCGGPNKLRKASSLRTTKSQQSFLSAGSACQPGHLHIAYTPSQASSVSQGPITYSSHYPNAIGGVDEGAQGILQGPTVTAKGSLQSLVSSCKREFSMKRSVRSSSARKKSSTDKSPLFTTTGLNHVPKIDIKKRISSFKKGFQNILHLRSKSSNSQVSLPSQQVEASRDHFTKFEDDYDEEEENRPLLRPLQEENDIEDVRQTDYEFTREINQEEANGLGAYDFLAPGDAQCVPSNSTVAVDDMYGSRVTSWADSSVASGLPCLPPYQVGKKRLSVIQENGGPHQPSAPTSHGAFQYPVPRTSSSNTAEPVDSNRVFSALQRHINQENHEFANPWTRDFDPRTHRDLDYKQSLLALSSHPNSTIRVVSGSSSTAQEMPAAAVSAQSLHGQMSVASEWTDDNVFSPSKRIDSGNAMELNHKPSRFEASLRRTPREANSAFFPSASGLRSKSSSPAVLSSPLKYRSGFVGLGAEHGSPSKDSAETNSSYSRATNGTPKLLKFSDHVNSGLDEARGNEGFQAASKEDYRPDPKLENRLNKILSIDGGTRHWTVPSLGEGKTGQDSSVESLLRTFDNITSTSHVRENAAINDEIPLALGRHTNKSTDKADTIQQSKAGERRLTSLNRSFTDQQNSQVSHVYPYIEPGISTETYSQLHGISSHDDARLSKLQQGTNSGDTEDFKGASLRPRVSYRDHTPSWIPSRQASLRVRNLAGISHTSEELAQHRQIRIQSSRSSLDQNTVVGREQRDVRQEEGSGPVLGFGLEEDGEEACDFLGRAPHGDASRGEALAACSTPPPASRHSPERVERLRRAHCDSSPRAQGPTRIFPQQPYSMERKQQQQKHQQQKTMPSSLSLSSSMWPPTLEDRHPLVSTTATARAASCENAPPLAQKEPRAPYAAGPENPWTASVASKLSANIMYNKTEVGHQGWTNNTSAAGGHVERWPEVSVGADEALKERVVSNGSVAFI